MIEATLITWILVVFGFALLFPLLIYVQIRVVTTPNSQKTKDVWLGKGADWRNNTQLEYACGAGWADLICWVPLGVIGSIGVLLGHPWGYGMWLASGGIAVYINIIYWFAERKYIAPTRGLFAYYTYEWGFWVYWGIAVVAYAVLRLAGVAL